MGWMGKLAGGMVGFALGGPLGALLGVGIGSLFDSSASASARARPRGLDPAEQAKAVYFTAVFSMLGKMAAADGQVQRSETDRVEEFIRLQGMGPVERAMAVNIFNGARRSPYTFADLARQTARVFRESPQLRLSLLDLLGSIAAADGVIHPAEERCLREAAEIFGLGEAGFRRVMREYGSAAGGDYAVLDSSDSDSDETVRANYRRLVKEFHPDRLRAKGLPEELMNHAVDKFRRIQEAWERIRKERNL